MSDFSSNWVAKLQQPQCTPLEKTPYAWIKREGAQLSGSAKYRMVFDRTHKAISQGHLRAGMVLCEASAGSTGVALAHVAHMLGAPCEVHVYQDSAREKIAKMESLGANVVKHAPSEQLFPIIQALGTRAAEGTAWYLNQYDKNTKDSYEALASELLAQLPEAMHSELLHLFCPVGTGGLIQGVGGQLRKQLANLKIVAVEPAENVVIDGIRNTQIVNMGPMDPYDRNFADATIRVTKLAPDGLEYGDSTRAALQAARELQPKLAIVLSPDNAI